MLSTMKAIAQFDGMQKQTTCPFLRHSLNYIVIGFQKNMTTNVTSGAVYYLTMSISEISIGHKKL